VVTADGKSQQFNIYSAEDRLVTPFVKLADPIVWSFPQHFGADFLDLATFSRLRQSGADRLVVDLLKNIEPALDSIDILAPNKQASLYVRLEPSQPMIPLTMMGAGFQRCFDIAISLGASHFKQVNFDEIDNGLHHSLLEPVWRWIATSSQRIGAQVNVTTHSEECVAAAAHVFKELGDDGLRVVRIDKRKDGSRAAVYDADLASVAVDEGVEIRG
jgi:predicted ATPase